MNDISGGKVNQKEGFGSRASGFRPRSGFLKPDACSLRGAADKPLPGTGEREIKEETGNGD